MSGLLITIKTKKQKMKLLSAVALIASSVQATCNFEMSKPFQCLNYNNGYVPCKGLNYTITELENGDKRIAYAGDNSIVYLSF